MESKFKMNKGAVSLSVVLLVLSCFVLISLSLTFFVIKEKDALGKIVISSDIDEIYVRQALLNFYVQDIFDKASEDFLIEEGVVVFVSNFKEELEMYRDGDGNYPIGELGDLENVDENMVELLEDRLVLRLDLVAKSKLEHMDITFNYQRDFEKVFK
tara:strand:+ start:177 stop:647 length:471 start_codon:yes stop_codon:yes gene_type:complete